MKWVEIEGFPDYEVSDTGVVRSRDRACRCRNAGVAIRKGRVLRQVQRPSGYVQVCLTEGVRKRCALVHAVVARAFLGPKPTPAHQVRHLDGNKVNNAVSNLAWGTAQENADDREAHGRTARGPRHWTQKRLTK